LDNARIDDGGSIAVALKLKFRGINAARNIGRKHEEEIDLLGGTRSEYSRQ